MKKRESGLYYKLVPEWKIEPHLTLSHQNNVEFFTGTYGSKGDHLTETSHLKAHLFGNHFLPHTTIYPVLRNKDIHYLSRAKGVTSPILMSAS